MVGKIAFWFLVVASAICYVAGLMKANDVHDTSDAGALLIIGFLAFGMIAAFLGVNVGYLH